MFSTYYILYYYTFYNSFLFFFKLKLKFFNHINAPSTIVY